MRIIAWSAVLIASLCARAVHAIEPWDALPAMEAVHLKGLYAGERVCPVCRHGYDAGILVFVPASLSGADARSLAGKVAPAALGIANPRFRTFILIAGVPSNDLVVALTVNDSRWFVAALSGDALVRAEADMQESLAGSVRGFVFAQRRLLRAFSFATPSGNDVAELSRQSQYALTLLNELHPDTGPNQGAMWFAPAQLKTSIDLSSTTNRQSAKVCFSTSESSRIANALARLRSSSTSKETSQHWARTDPRGCVEIEGAKQGTSFRVTLYENGQPAQSGRLDLMNLASATEVVVGPGRETETVVGLPCENCESVFMDLPSSLATVARIAPVDEPGEALQVQGRVLDRNGKPGANVIIYAYHTNRAGTYPATAGRLRLRGWAISDEQGRYTFTTIRPGSYPDRAVPAHIHMHIIEPGRCTYYLDDVVFADDPRLKLATIDRAPRGGSGLTNPQKDSAGTWQVTRDIHLGRNVPGYERCDANSTRRPSA